ncbi:MAG: biopolymer transporter ExbD [Candidatus Nealsonbacteria bacterium]|nr:biopolymer transporter ExbD [Candidatus Nealsonbacteria bacterium]
MPRYRLLAWMLTVLTVLGINCIATAADAPAKPLRAGIIGLDTSHVIAFTKLLNDPNAQGDLADVQVVAGYPGGMKDNPSSWDRVPQYTKQLREQGIEICETIPELLEKVDVVLLESVDGRPHLEEAKPVIAAGKPLFVDKPLAGSLADSIEIFQLAEKAKVPCFSSSSLRFSSGFLAARRGEPFGKVKSCTAWSPMSIEPHHPDLFWYGIHGVEILFTIMGPGCEKVTRVEQNKVVGVWKDGRVGTFIGQKGYGATVEGEKSSGDAGKYEGYKPLVVEICRFFKTGKSPVAAAETLEIYAFMEAADESKRQGGKPVLLDTVMRKAVESKLETDFKVPLPVKAVPAVTANTKIVEVNEDGSITFERDNVTLEQLAERLAAARKKDPNVSVLVRGDHKGKYERVAEVLSACQRAGVQQLKIAVRDSSPEN